MAAPKNSVLRGLIKVLQLTADATQSEQLMRELVRNVGWDLDELAGFSIGDISQAIGPLSDDLQQLLPFLEDFPDSFSDVKTVLQHLQQAFGRIERLAVAIEQAEFDGPDADKLKEFSKDVLNFLLVIGIRAKSPILFHVLFLLTILDYKESNIQPIATAAGKIIRYPSMVPYLQFGKLGDLLSDPVTLLQQYYFPNQLQTDEDALFAAHRLFPRVANLLHEFDLSTTMGFNPQHGVSLGTQSDPLLNGMFTVFSEPEQDGFDFGVTLALSPASRGNLGLVVTPFGQLNFAKVFADWLFELEVSAGVEAFAMGPDGADFLAGVDSTSVALNLRAVKVADAAQGPAYLLGGQEGTRLEIGSLRFDTELRLLSGDFDLDLLLQAQQMAFVLMPGDGDGFLASVLPEKGIRLELDLGLGWSRQHGIYFKGSVGLEAIYEFHQSLLGVLKLQTLRLKLEATPQGLSFLTDAVLEVKIGPLRGLVSNMGIQLDTQFVDEGGNAGIADTSLGFKPPDGLGFLIDAKVVKGGGFLRFGDGEYLGFAELEVFEKFSLKAIGIITTKLPEGQEGYSFLLIITAEFAPIPLGFGFTLDGVGGVIGLHRGLHLDNIRSGVKTGIYDYVLFPKNPLADLPKIINGVNAILPIQQDRYTFGLLARIGWGSPKILDIKAGLIFEIPSWKLALVGVATAEIQRNEKALVRLQLNFAITYNPEKALLTFDGSLTNSRLLSWKLEGDLAIRIRGGSEPDFLLSAGGFHRDFVRPTGLQLPTLQPLKITIADGNPNIYAQLFFAITTNTLQMGGSAHASYAKYGIGFEANLGFEALIQFNPLHFNVEVWGDVALQFFGASFGLGLRGQVEGPYPLVMSLYVTFKVWIFSKTVRLPTITIGKKRDTRLDKVEVWPLLREQLADERNWQADLPDRHRSLVSIRSAQSTIPGATPETAPDKYHPLGGIVINQTRVPLNQKMELYGQQEILDFSTFSIQLQVADRPVAFVREFFAPVQFFRLTEAEKFNRKSFEKFDSGIRLSNGDTITAGAVVEKEATYEEKIIAPETGETRKKTVFDSWNRFDQFRHDTSVALSRQGKKHRHTVVHQRIRPVRETFALINALDLEIVRDEHNNQLANLTQSELELMLQKKQREQPALAQNFEVVPMYEL